MVIERVKGPIEILFAEIGYPFDPTNERPEVLVAFVRVLYGQIADMMAWRSAISRGFREDGFNALEARAAFMAVGALMVDPLRDREQRCAELHNGVLDQPDDGPCNRFIEMLSSCVSAIRFGLESPCQSRHAAHAADHIWQHKYGIRLFDKCTSDWSKDWTRRQIQTAFAEINPVQPLSPGRKEE